jgi:hypothetical protein
LFPLQYGQYRMARDLLSAELAQPKCIGLQG